MSNFRTRFLGLAAAGLAFAGLSYGQFQCGTNFNGAPLPGGTIANGQTTTALNGVAYSPTELRQTATNDLVADLYFQCGGQSPALSSGTLTVTLTAPVTSKQLTTTSNEATLIITPLSPGGPATAYSGVVTGSTVTFSGVSFPGNTVYGVEIANIRVNSGSIAIGTAVTESVFIGNLSQVLFSGAAIPVGFVEPDFSTPVVTTLNTTSYPICVGVTGAAAFTISETEKFGGAFKAAIPSGIAANGGGAAYTCGGQPCNLANGSTGSYPFPTAPGLSAGIGTGAGQATHGTRFTLTFANIPSGVTIYLPTLITSNVGEATVLVAYLTTSATGAFTPVTATTGAPNIGGSTSWAVPASGVAVYEIAFADDTQQNLTFSIPGDISFAANFANTPQAAMTVTMVQAPDSAVNTSTNDVPNFSASNTALTLESFNLCQTTLLFPFVTSVAGFETGIALSNTSTDPGNIAGGGVHATATPNQGSCTLNFYGATNGTTATYTAVAAPAPGGGTTPYTQPTGTTNAFGIVNSNLVPTGFSGYMIAQCNYLYGHGFAYISYLLGTAEGSTMGYLPLVIGARPTTGTSEEALTE